MKYNRTLFLIGLLLQAFPLFAQDLITTVKGEQFNTRVKRIDKEVVRTSGIQGSYSGAQENLPLPYVQSIAFEDGFKLVFLPDGSFSREGLYAAPTVRLKGGIPYAEGIIPLTGHETEQRIGTDRYHLRYMPGRSWTKAGEIQLALGGIATVIGYMADDKYLVYNRKGMSHIFTKLSIYRSDGTITDAGHYRFKGSYTPWSVISEIGGISILTGGIANLVIGNIATRKAFSDPAGLLPSQTGTRWQFWSGIGLTAAGTGAFVAGSLLLDKGREFDWELYADRNDSRNRRDGYISFAGPILTFSGALAASLGVGMTVQAGKRLKSFEKGTARPVADLRFGPTPDGGCGLTMVF